MNQPLVNLSFDKLRDNKISFWTKKKERKNCTVIVHQQEYI